MKQKVEKAILVQKNNNAVVGLVLGLLAFVGWGVFIFGLWAVPFGLLLAFLGVFFAIRGLKARKWIAILAIVLCLINVIPTILLGWTLYQVKVAEGRMYNAENFSIEVPAGWIKVVSPIEVKTLQVAFAPKSNNDVYQPRMLIFTSKSEGTLLESGKAREVEIKADPSHTIILSAPVTLNGRDAYVIEYTFTNQDDKIMSTDFLTIFGETTYLVNISAQDTAYSKYSKELTNSFWTLTAR